MSVPENEAIPSGSVAYDDVSADNNTYGLQTDSDATPIVGNDEGAGEAGGKEEGDKGKAGDDYAERYAQLNSKFGEQGQELGGLRKANADLAGQVAELQRSFAEISSKAGSDNPDYDAKVSEIANAMEEGDISMADGLKQMALLSKDLGRKEAASYIGEMTQKQKQEEIVTNFKKNHADFDELVGSGSLDAIKQSNPMHDNFSAYFAFKAMQAGQSLEAASKEAFDKGLSTQDKLRQGAEGTKTVLQRPGSNARQTPANKGPVSGEARRSSMAAVLTKMRAG